VKLPVVGSFTLPLAPAATSRLLAPALSAPAVAKPSTGGSGLPATGLATVLPTAGAGMLALLIARRRRLTLTRRARL
jgi:hypothetical protein